MKKFVSLISIVVAFYSYSSKANEFVGKGLVCHYKYFSNRWDEGKPYIERIYGYFFKSNDLVEVWEDAYRFHSRKHQRRKEKEIYNNIRKRLDVQNISRLLVPDFEFVSRYEFWKTLTDYKFQKSNQTVTYKFNDFHIVIDFQGSDYFISRSSLSIKTDFMESGAFKNPLLKFDKRSKCYPQADKEQLLKSLNNYIPLIKKKHKNRVLYFKPYADAFYKKLNEVELEIKEKLKNKKF